MIQTYTRRDLTNTPAVVGTVLESMAGYEYKDPYAKSASHKRIGGALKRHTAKPFTVVVFAETLDRKHRRDKRFVTISRVKICSEIDEEVYARYGKEVNERMGRFLENHRDPGNKHLSSLLREYYPKVKGRLRRKYRERFPRSWRFHFNMANLTAPRIQEQRERRYDLPPPLNRWDDRNRYQQYFVVPGRQAIVRGGSGSSYQREIKSKYGYAFAAVNKEANLISYLFVYTRHNRLKYVDTVYEFCLVGRDIGSNYQLPRRESEAILQDTVKVEKQGPLHRIREIVLFKEDGTRE